ncbi:MAG: hypothetical protein SVX43_16460 [Cyanobacteriota bacterium]|nr:hypothetical protein [Cyanobacteriota bacterium]
MDEYLQDPEHKLEFWDEPIIASNPEEAERECQKRAKEYKVRLESVTQPKRIEQRPQRYRCNYVGELEEGELDGDRN